jgi:hypothetical protein
MRGRVAAGRNSEVFILWMLLTLEMLVKACKYWVKIGRITLFGLFRDFLLRG